MAVKTAGTAVRTLSAADGWAAAYAAGRAMSEDEAVAWALAEAADA